MTIESKLPPDELREFGINVFRGPFNEVKKTIEANGIDVNSVFDEKKNQTLLSSCIRGFNYGSENTILTEYLLDKGANPNIPDSSGNSAFHLAIYSQNLALIELMMPYQIEVNQKAEGGYTTFFAFLKYTYAEIATKGIPIKKRCLAIIDEMLRRGADIHIKSAHGSSARTEFFPEMASVLSLFKKYDELAVPKQESANLRPPSKLKHPEICKQIWQQYVPQSGESDTVVGELLRAVEKLRDEAQRNGNGNYNAMHKSLAIYLEHTLISFDMFDATSIEADIKPLTLKTQPYLEDDIYDRICDRIAEIYIKFPEPIYRTKS